MRRVIGTVENIVPGFGIGSIWVDIRCLLPGEIQRGSRVVLCLHEEHHCDDMPLGASVCEVQDNSGAWTAALTRDVNQVNVFRVTHCPWCGVKLGEQKE